MKLRTAIPVLILVTFLTLKLTLNQGWSYTDYINIMLLNTSLFEKFGFNPFPLYPTMCFTFALMLGIGYVFSNSFGHTAGFYQMTEVRYGSHVKYKKAMIINIVKNSAIYTLLMLVQLMLMIAVTLPGFGIDLNTVFSLTFFVLKQSLLLSFMVITAEFLSKALSKTYLYAVFVLISMFLMFFDIFGKITTFTVIGPGMEMAISTAILLFLLFIILTADYLYENKKADKGERYD